MDLCFLFQWLRSSRGDGALIQDLHRCPTVLPVWESRGRPGKDANGWRGRIKKKKSDILWNVHPPRSLIHLAEVSQTPPTEEGRFYPLMEWEDKLTRGWRKKKTRRSGGRIKMSKRHSLQGERTWQQVRQRRFLTGANLGWFDPLVVKIWWDGALWQRCLDLLDCLWQCQDSRSTRWGFCPGCYMISVNFAALCRADSLHFLSFLFLVFSVS